MLKATCLAVLILFHPATRAQNIKPQTQTAELYVQTGHSALVNAVAFSPDGKTLASASWDSTIKLWNAETGQELRTLSGHTGFVESVAYSPDGKVIASGGTDKTIKLWSAETGQQLKTLTGHQEEINSVAFSPDGKSLASASDDKTVKLWSIATGQELRTLDRHISFVNSVAFSPDGKILASGSTDKAIHFWNVRTGELIKRLTGHIGLVASVAFSPDGKTFASGSYDNTVKLWSAVTGEELRTLTGHPDWVNFVAFSPGGKILASASTDKTVKLWDIKSGQEIRTLSGHINVVRALAFAPDGKTLGSASSDDTTKLWNTETGRELRTFTGHTETARRLTFSPDGKVLAMATRGSKTKLWSVATGQELRTLSKHTADVNSVVFSPDGKILASASKDKTIKLWSVETGQEIRTLAGHTKNVGAVAFSPDGKFLVSASDDKTLKLWNVETGQEIRTLTGHDKEVALVVFSPDGTVIASAGGLTDNKIKLWNTETGRELRTLSGHYGYIESFAFSSDGKTFVSASKESVIKLWNVATGQELQHIAGHTGSVDSIALSPDGKILAFFASGDNTIKLWNTETRQLIKSLAQTDPNSMREVFKIVPDFSLSGDTISKDGRFQIKRGINGRLDLYEVKTGKLLVSLVAFNEADWAVVTPEGLFDGSPAAWKLLAWRLSDRLYDLAPVEAFFNEFYRPGLLQDIFAGRKIEQPTRDIATIDIRQPSVAVKLSDAKQIAANISTRQITINIEVTDAPADARRTRTSGAKDVRLFRNGSLVRVWRGDVLNGKAAATLAATVAVVSGDNNFTAYAFNRENVKSRDGELSLTGADSLKRKGTAYILAIGVNEYANTQYNLRYAVADAQGFSEELKRRQEGLGIYERVEVTLLINEHATKEKIISALTALQGRAQPEDTLAVYFAGHGTAQGNRFYLIPHDLGYTGERMNVDAAGLQEMLRHSISDEELEAAFEQTDAGQLLMVLDACNSGQALEAEEKRRGPMNSKGLAQLAYEKGMYILTAAQSFQAAKEASQVGHGLLTYALIEEGLKQAVADGEPRDGQIAVREWLDYATGRVPQMQVEKMQAARALGLDLAFKEEERGLNAARRSGQQPRVFYRRELEQRPLIVARPGASQSER